MLRTALTVYGITGMRLTQQQANSAERHCMTTIRTAQMHLGTLH
jgi:hypothetical protein